MALYKKSEREGYVKDLFDEKEFNDSQVYNAEKMGFSIFHKLFETVVELSLWASLCYVLVWNKIDSVMSSIGLCSDEPYRNDII